MQPAPGLLRCSAVAVPRGLQYIGAIAQGGVIVTLLLAGLLLFIGVHSLRLVADGWRTRMIARVGLLPWKAAYALLSLAGFVLLVQGYADARASAVLYDPPHFTRYIAGLLMLISLVLVAAAYVPRNHIKAALGHPMLAGVKLWAFAHLLSNGRLSDVILFGVFLAWSITAYLAARRRDRAAGTVYPPGDELRTMLAVIAGVGVWAALVSGLHQVLIGVPPFV